MESNPVNFHNAGTYVGETSLQGSALLDLLAGADVF